MAKFYPHVMEDERERSYGWLEKAKQVAPHVHLGEYNLLKLEYFAEHGLPSCYPTFQDMLYDFYPDFSWNDTGLKQEVNYILAQTERFEKVRVAILREWNFDMNAELQQALED